MKSIDFPKHKGIAEIEISYTPSLKLSCLPVISNSEQTYRLFLNTWESGKIEFIEQFKVMLINRNNKVMGICTLSTGTIHGTLVDPKILFGVALKAGACGIILAHNHPSGNLLPSRADFEIATRLQGCAELLGIHLLDNLILTTEGYYSFADEGAL